MSFQPYNERLFKNPIRGYFHLSRFMWLNYSVQRSNPSFDSVFELGCFDGRSINFLPNPPQEYFGYDRNWEGGLSSARLKFRDNENYHFLHCDSYKDFLLPEKAEFSFAICMETLEHLNDSDLLGYLEILRKHVKGPIFITVPNEIGFFFGIKFLIKALFFKERLSYSKYEYFMQVFGKSQYVERLEHKGFNYKVLRRILLEKFTIISEEGIPFKRLPNFCNSQIGWVCLPK